MAKSNKRTANLSPKVTLEYLIKVGKGEIVDPEWSNDTVRLRSELRRKLPGFLSKATVTEEDIDMMLGIEPVKETTIIPAVTETVSENDDLAATPVTSELQDDVDERGISKGADTQFDPPPPDEPSTSADEEKVVETEVVSSAEEVAESVEAAVVAPATTIKLERPVRKEPVQKDPVVLAHIDELTHWPIYQVPIIDPDRDARSAAQWTDVELLALCTGHIKSGPLLTEATVTNALKRRFSGLQAAWDYKAIKAYLITGEKPARTDDGIWVSDITRATRGLSRWSDNEIAAFLKGEISEARITPIDMMAELRSRYADQYKLSDEQLISYARDGILPEMTDGIVLDDPKRLAKRAVAWSQKELVLYARGVLKSTENASDADLMRALRRVFKADPAWTDAQAIAFVANNRAPEKTSNGVWIVDVTRDAKSLDELTIPECEAMCKGEISSRHFVTPIKAIRYLRERLRRKFGERIDHWSNSELFAFCSNGTVPQKTPSGHWPNSPIRELLSANEWSKAEILAWIAGELKPTRNAPPNKLEAAVYYKWRLDPTWPLEHAIAFVVSGTIPPKTSTDVWVFDISRPYRRPIEWTTAELIAFTRGELPLDDDYVASEDTLYDEICDRFELSHSFSNEHVRKLISNLKKEPSTMTLDAIRQSLDSYAAAMAPGKRLTEQEAADQQVGLYRTINKILPLENQEFHRAWAMLLDFVNRHANTHFSLETASRGWDYLDLADRDRKNFESLLNLIRQTANPVGRKARLRQSVRLDYSLRGIRRDDWRNKIVAFYEA